MKGRNYNIRKVRLWVAVMLAAFIASACGADDGSLNVTITDGYCSTIITVSEGETVSSVLTRAEITLSEGDCSTPEADEAITMDGTEIEIRRWATVSVNEEGETTEVVLVGANVRDAIEEAGVALGEHDVVNHSLDAYLTDGMEIEVEHWNEVLITVSGKETSVLTQAQTVEQLLSEQGIELTDQDRVTPALDTEITSDCINVEVQYVSTRRETVESVVSYETVYEDSDTLYVGETAVAQEGQDGIIETTYIITYVDGIEESRVASGSTVTQEAVDEIILVGTKEEEPEPEPESESGSQDTSESDDDGRKIVSKEAIYDCDGSGNGYYIIEYEDGTIEYEDFYDPDFW